MFVHFFACAKKRNQRNTPQSTGLRLPVNAQKSRAGFKLAACYALRSNNQPLSPGFSCASRQFQRGPGEGLRNMRILLTPSVNSTIEKGDARSAARMGPLRKWPKFDAGQGGRRRVCLSAVRSTQRVTQPPLAGVAFWGPAGPLERGAFFFDSFLLGKQKK